MSARPVVALSSLLAAAGLSLAAPAPARAPAPSAVALARGEQVAARRAAEARRVQSQLDVAIAALRAADVRHLTPAQRERRARQVARLEAYRDRGVFPRNEHFTDVAIPYFIDRSGTRCAVAHLMELDGRGHVVRHVADTRNQAYVAELADEPGMAEWLREAGLTLDEAALVQEPYMIDPEPQVTERPSAARVGTAYAAASAVAGVAAGASIAYTLRHDVPSRRRTALGLAAGLTGVALGAPRLGDGGTARTLGAANTAVGLAATAVALHSLFRDGAASNVASAKRERAVAIAPVVGREVGVTLAARF